MKVTMPVVPIVLVGAGVTVGLLSSGTAQAVSWGIVAAAVLAQASLAWGLLVGVLGKR